MLNRRLVSMALASGLLMACGRHLHAQEPASAPPKQALTPLKVTVTISRFQGEKRISQLPYTLSISLDPLTRSAASRRIGTKVPITTSSTPQGGGTPVMKVEYQDIGTSIDCRAYRADESGRYRLDVTVEETSVTDNPAGKGVIEIGRPTFRSFVTSESLMVRNGQTVEMSSTPDRTTGEVVKVEVALEVIK